MRVSVSERTVTRLLVIDDSVRVRRVLARVLAREPGVEIVAAMRNGRAAVRRSERLEPDVVLLDAEVAGDGDCATLRELRRLDPQLRVVMRELGEPFDERLVREHVLPAIRGQRAARRGAELTAAAVVDPPAPLGGRPLPGRPPGRAARVRAIAIAASTGGPDALEVVLSRLPADLPVPVFIVQHMPVEFTGLLAERLDRRSELCIAEAAGEEQVRAGHVYVAPGGRHLAIARVSDGVRTVVHDGARENSCRPAADVLFRSAAEVYGAGLLGVVLTGMGQDGLAGAAAIRQAAGRVLAQSETTAVIASMPAAVARHGLADAVLDLANIGPRLAALAQGRGMP